MRFLRGALFRITSPLRGLKQATGNEKFFKHNFRITSPLRGLKLNSDRLSGSSSNFRIISPLRGHQINASLYLKSRYLCVTRLGITSYA